MFSRAVKVYEISSKRPSQLSNISHHIDRLLETTEE
jgi:hypothetical protein